MVLRAVVGVGGRGAQRCLAVVGACLEELERACACACLCLLL